MSKFLFPLIIFILAGFFIYRTWTNHKVADENFAKGQAFLLENAKKKKALSQQKVAFNTWFLKKAKVRFTQRQQVK